MRIFAKDISADTQAVVGECYFLGAELYHTTDTHLDVFNEPSNAKTAANLICKLATTDETQQCKLMLPKPGIKCDGLYVDYTAGDGTIYYAL